MRDVYEWLLASRPVLGLLGFVIAALVGWSRLVRTPRLFLKLMSRSIDGTRVVRLLIHNAESLMIVDQLTVSFEFSATQPHGKSPVKQVRANAGPMFPAEAFHQSEGGQLHTIKVVTRKGLVPGRSWLLSMDLPSDACHEVRCSISGLKPVPWQHELKALDHENDATRDTLTPTGFVVASVLLAIVVGAATMLLLLPDAWKDPVPWWELFYLLIAIIGVSVVLYRVLRPNRPCVALGYGHECPLSVQQA